MNILHISRTMGQGGAEKVVFQICKDVKDNNMVVASTGGVYEKEMKQYNIKHYKIPDLDNKNPLFILKTFIILNKIIKKEKIDIVHSHHRMAAFYSRIINIFNRNFSRVYTAHNVFYNKINLSKFALKGSKIVAVGNGVKNNLIKVYEINEKKIDIIYNSIEIPKKIDEITDEFFYKEKDKILIGNIGRISEQKGMDVFLKALEISMKKNDKIIGVIIGDGELKNELQNLSKELNIDSRIIFLGFRKDVLNIIKNLNFVILSSRWEGFPLTPIEVFSQKKTIIVSNIDGNNEIVKNEHNGLLFEKDNYIELSNKIDELIANKSLLNKLEKNALNDYTNIFSYKKFIDNYKNIYLNCEKE